MTNWGEIFEHYGVKTVTKTDKSKGAYVPTREQLAAVEAAGITPSPDRPAIPFDVAVLFDDQRSHVRATYYHAMRQTAGRPPEPRLGTEIISAWLNEGDHVVIGNVGNQLFAAKDVSVNVSEVEVAEAVARKSSPALRQALIDKAKEAQGKPDRKRIYRDDYVRNPAVVMGAIARSGGKCEMPDCSCEMFLRADGSPYLEVHHITRLADQGDDSLVNAAALCPRHHRELHHGANRIKLRDALAEYIREATP